MSAPVLHITDRLRGKYTLAVNDGAGLLNGSDTFTRQFETPPIQHEAAALIEELAAALIEALTWIRNWDPNFTQDDEWPDARRLMEAAIAKAQPTSGQSGEGS